MVGQAELEVVVSIKLSHWFRDNSSETRGNSHPWEFISLHSHGCTSWVTFQIGNQTDSPAKKRHVVGALIIIPIFSSLWFKLSGHFH